MTVDGARSLSVTADLRLVVDNTPATIVANGSRVTVRTANAGHLVATALISARTAPLNSSSARQLAAQVSHALDELGLSARLIGRHGTVIEMGRGSQSPAARLLLGGSPVKLGSVSTLLRTAAQYGRTDALRGRPAQYASAFTIVAAALAAVRARRKTRAVPIPALPSTPTTRNG